MKKLILITLSLFLMIACQQEEKTVTKTVVVEAPTNNGSGGMDSSGGDTIVSSFQQVKSELNNLNKKSAEVLYRLSLELLLLPKTSINKIYGEDAHQVLQKFFAFDGHSFEEVIKGIKDKKINIRIEEDQYCKSNFGKDHKAGSAHGAFDSGEICLSIKALRANNPEALEKQTVALFLHELGHIFGLDEEEAEMIQKIVLRGSSFLIIPDNEKQRIFNLANELEKRFQSRKEKFFYKSSRQDICQEINKTLNITSKLEVRATIQESEYFERIFPSYISSNVLNLSALIKKINGYCGIQFGASKYLKKDEGEKLNSIEKGLFLQIESLTKRLKHYLRPLLFAKNIQNHQSIFTSYMAYEGDSFKEFIKDSLGKKYPQECLLAALPENYSFLPMGTSKGFRIHDMYSCQVETGREEWGYPVYDYYQIPLFWNPNKKLPYSIKRKAEGFFEDKILELKMRETFHSYLGYLLPFLAQKKFPKATRSILVAGLTPILSMGDQKTIKNEILNDLIDVLISYEHSRGREVESLIVYGFRTGANMGVVHQSKQDYYDIATRIADILENQNDYAVKFQLIKIELTNMQIDLFI